jgi:hypothetical protein
MQHVLVMMDGVAVNRWSRAVDSLPRALNCRSRAIDSWTHLTTGSHRAVNAWDSAEMMKQVLFLMNRFLIKMNDVPVISW